MLLQAGKSIFHRKSPLIPYSSFFENHLNFLVNDIKKFHTDYNLNNIVTN